MESAKINAIGSADEVKKFDFFWKLNSYSS